jgi:hypothetical protein
MREVVVERPLGCRRDDGHDPGHLNDDDQYHQHHAAADAPEHAVHVQSRRVQGQEGTYPVNPVSDLNFGTCALTIDAGATISSPRARARRS